MQIALDDDDIQKIVNAVTERLRPFLSGAKEEVHDLMDMEGLCAYLQVTPKWVHERTHLKEIPFIKLSNKQLRFRKKDIEKWLDSLSTPAFHDYRGRIKVQHHAEMP